MKKIICFLLVAILIIPTCYSASAKKQINGVWVASVGNLDFPSKTALSADRLKNEIDTIVLTCKSQNINTIFFQVRPNSDALYKSEIFPWSEVLSGTQGVAPSGNFDPLEYFVKIAHENDIQLHAWINPYRIGDVSKACDSNPAKLHPEYTVTCSDGKTYYNPALADVRELVADGVREIIDNYDVDGIHFDDYFYPYDVENFDDAEAFEKYGKDFENIADFRRNNVNLLVESVNELVHSKNKKLKFGISPFGIWDNLKDNPLGSNTAGMSSYSQIYADSRYWVCEKMVDYICPQVYWSFENTVAPFDVVVKWWNELCKKNSVDLYIGLALYKQGTDEKGFEISNQIKRQKAFCETQSAVDGVVTFRYGSLLEKTDTEIENVKTPPLISGKVVITSPTDNYQTEGENCSVMGIADPTQPLVVNGKEITMTEHGYFSVYMPLNIGKNEFKFKNGDSSDSVTVYRKEIKESYVKDELFKNVFPKDNCMFYAGENITLSVKTEKDCDVYARIDQNDIKLVANEDGTVYQADYMLPNTMLPDEKITISFYAIKDSKQIDAPQKAEITVLTKPLELYTTEESYVYDSYLGGSMMDNYQYPVGERVLATAFAENMYRLVTGKWIYADKVSENQTERTVDIDTSKYVETLFSFKNPCTYQCDVTESGLMIIDFYHNAGDTPKVNKGDGINVKLVKSSTHTKALVSQRGFYVTGYYIEKNKDNTIKLWIYKRQKDGVKDKTIVIDVGHGGSDPGALGPAGKDGITESDLNLSLSLMLKSKLENEGAKVFLTREGDSTLLLEQRAQFIRSFNPDLCISVHHNSVSPETDYNTATGLLTLYSRETSFALADGISKYISNATGIENDGAKMQSLNVCRDYRYPCVLLECGFVCNPAEYEKLLTDSYKNTVCNNIVMSINDYFS